MPEGLVTVAYIVSGVLFILSLRGLSHQETARNGNLYGMLGMIIAVAATLFAGNTDTLWILIVVMLAGSGIGIVVARYCFNGLRLKGNYLFLLLLSPTPQ